jgi:hypothetical protein
MFQALRISPETQITESVRSDPSNRRKQKEKGGDQDRSIKETLKIGRGQKAKKFELRSILASPKDAWSECCTKENGCEQIDENL